MEPTWFNLWQPFFHEEHEGDGREMKNKRERKKRWKRKLERERKHPKWFFSKRDRGMHLFKPQNNYLDINEPHRLILEGSRRFDFSVLIRSTNICSTLNQLQLFTGNLSGLRIWIFSSLKCLEFRPLRRSKARIWKLEKLQNGAFRIPNAEPLTPVQNWTVSETPQIFRNTSRHQSKNTSKLRIITEHTDASNIS